MLFNTPMPGQKQLPKRNFAFLAKQEPESTSLAAKYKVPGPMEMSNRTCEIAKVDQRNPYNDTINKHFRG